MNTLDITGTYDLHDGTNMGLTIRGVDTANNNALVDSFIRTPENDIIPVTGTFTQGQNTNSLSFSTAHQPGLILFTTFYIGAAIGDPKSLGGIFALSGTWSRQVIEFSGSGPKKTLKIVNQSGGWFADNHQAEIQ